MTQQNTTDEKETNSLGFVIQKINLKDSGCMVLDKKPNYTGIAEFDRLDANGDGVISPSEIRNDSNVKTALSF
jgi:hypothetical protein